MDWRVFRKVFRSSVLLALPGVLMNTFFTGCFARLALRVYRPESTDAVSWEAALLLSSILSATDPVAVVASLHELGAPKKLASLIEGESLLNDGSAVVFFLVFLDMVAKSAPDSSKQCLNDFPDNSGCLLAYFCQLALGGPLLGAALGIFLFFWIGLLRLRHLPELEVAIVLIHVYFTFYLAESVHVSGVLAVVALGVVVSAIVEPRLSHDGRHAHHFVLKQVGYMCNQIIFFAAGIVTARFMWTDNGCTEPLFESPRAWLELGALYLCIHFTRGAVVLLLYPLLRRWGYGITWKEAAILVWGGLRGAVGLALGLIVEHDEYVDRAVAAMLAFHVSGICLLTLLLNGTTVEYLYKRLEPYPPNPFRKKYLRNVLLLLEEVCKAHFVNRLSGDWFFEELEYEPLTKCVPNFTDVEFNSAGVPHPNVVSTVVETLHNLETSAGAVQSNRSGKGPKQGMLRRKDTWVGEDVVESSPLFTNLSKSVANNPDEKDILINLQSSGDQSLESVPSTSALYISSRPLNVVCDVGEDSEAPSFGVTLGHLGTPVLIGLSVHRKHSDIKEGREKDTFGTIAGTVALDCSSGVIRLFGPNGPEALPSNITDIAEGDTIFVSVVPVEDATPTATCELEVWFEIIRAPDARSEGSSENGDESQETGKRPPKLEVEEAPEKVFIGKCPLYGETGDLSTVYPAVQFLEFGHSSTNLFRRGSFKELVAQVTASPKHMANLTTQFTNQMQGGFNRMRIGGSTGSTETLRNSRSGATLSQNVHSSKVYLSFELQTASLEETTQQLFRVMFNTVSQVYRDLHEHGLIGTNALSCLQEAVGEALDCAENELHHATLHDYSEFEAFVAPTTSVGSSSSSLSSNRYYEKETVGKSKRSYLVLFEPAVVQFLSLQELTTAQTWAERVPFLSRRAGYMRTLTQVECLWAFVEAHNKLICGSTALRRFPDLLDCLGIIQEQAKAEISTLNVQQPRRCFYAKHFVALRMLLAQKLEKLQSFTHEGWLSLEDGEALREALWDRVKEVDCFVPRRKARDKGSVSNQSTRFQALMSPIASEEVSQRLQPVMPAPVAAQQGPTSSMPATAISLTPKARLEATFRSDIRKPTGMDDESMWRQNFAKLVGLDSMAPSSIGSSGEASGGLDSFSMLHTTPHRSHSARPRMLAEALPTPTLRTPKPSNTIAGVSPSASSGVAVMLFHSPNGQAVDVEGAEHETRGTPAERKAHTLSPLERLDLQPLNMPWHGEPGGDAAAGFEAHPPVATTSRHVRSPDGRSPVLHMDDDCE